MNTTALVTDRRYLKHFAGPAHPEVPERVAVLNQVVERLDRSRLRFIAPREASIDELALCHRRDYIAMVEQTSALSGYDFDSDTHASPDSYATAVLAAGGTLTAVEAVMDGEAANAFAIVRPPGHHARAAQAMGFCFFNNVAIAAAYLIQVRALRRVMIVDWDLHHGNGTQEIFYESPQVLYTSTHQYPHYPGTGALDEIGAGAGSGFTVNAPMPAGWGDAEYLRMFDELIIPIGRQFKPEFILVSAGFDCHYRDPLGEMRVTEAGFVAMTRRLKRLAAESCDGRLALALEGGYDLPALAASTQAVIEELGRDADEPIAAVRGGSRAIPIIERARYLLSPFWNFP